MKTVHFKKRPKRILSHLPLYKDGRQKMAIYEPRSRLSPDNGSDSALTLDFLASKTVINNFLVFMPHNL